MIPLITTNTGWPPLQHKELLAIRWIARAALRQAAYEMQQLKAREARKEQILKEALRDRVTSAGIDVTHGKEE